MCTSTQTGRPECKSESCHWVSTFTLESCPWQPRIKPKLPCEQECRIGKLAKEIEMLQGSCHCGAVKWTFDVMPAGATACNCTVCRRYGVLWIYDYEGEKVHVSGTTSSYVRGKSIEFHFCPSCGCVSHWRAQRTDEDGRRRLAVNVRLSEPETVANIPIDHFDGLDTFEDLPRDGKCVSDYWY